VKEENIFGFCGPTGLIPVEVGLGCKAPDLMFAETVKDETT
jgi:hypothetical protein